MQMKNVLVNCIKFSIFDLLRIDFYTIVMRLLSLILFYYVFIYFILIVTLNISLRGKMLRCY